MTMPRDTPPSGDNNGSFSIDFSPEGMEATEKGIREYLSSVEDNPNTAAAEEGVILVSYRGRRLYV